jgi:hypothetical protein
VHLAVIALLIGLGSNSWAAPLAKAPKSLVADVKRALKLGKSANRKARKALAEATKARQAAGPGPQGLPGAAGPQGPAGAKGDRGLTGSAGKPGSGLGYAQIEYCGDTQCEDFHGPGWFSSDDTNSPGIDNSVNFRDPAGVGVFCYLGLPFSPHVVMANIGTVGDPDVPIPYLVSAWTGADHPLDECAFPADTDSATTAAIYVRDMTGALTDPSTDLRLWELFG